MVSPLITEMTGLRAQLVSGLDALIAKALSDDKTILRNQFALRMLGEDVIAWSASLYDGADRRTNRVEAYEGLERRGPYAVVFGDINDFKAFNTRYSHEKADFAIIEAGRHLKRIADVCRGEAFRRSGDEFVILLPKSQIDQLRHLLRETFSACSVKFEDESAEFAMSFGFCDAEPNATFSEFLNRAETACEFAKRAGGGTLVGWTVDQEAQRPKSLRERCANCNTVVALLIPPELHGDAVTYKCPVCTEGILGGLGASPTKSASVSPISQSGPQ